MRKAKLILIEGIPGSGKSTLAQFIAHALTRQGIDCQWRYEEEKDHPLYVFHDLTSLQHTIDALNAGHYRHIVKAALEKWRVFAQELQSSETVVILDGCLFGYLTWSLFPLDIPAAEIHAYLSQVEQIIRHLQPCLIYLHQQNLPQALERICERRGSDTRTRLTEQATLSPYGQRRGLQGFDGMITYWNDFRTLIEAALLQFDISKLTLENSAREWSMYEQSVLDFLDLPVDEEVAFAPFSLKNFVGTYSYKEDDEYHMCLVQLKNNSLIVDGMPQVWSRTRLIPRSRNVFAIESLPFSVTFEEDAHGTTEGMKVTGPELLSGNVDRFFVREKEV